MADIVHSGINAQTSGSQQDPNNIFSKDVLISAVTAILVSLLQVKFQNERKSAFETDFATMVAFIVAVHVYCVALLAKEKLVETCKAYAEIINYYVHLCGFVSNVLLVMILVPILGRIFLCIWACFFIAVTCRLLAKINDPPATAENGDNSNRMPNSSGSAEANRDGSNQAPNGFTNEESNGDGTNEERNAPTDEESNGDNSAIRTSESALEFIV